MSDYALQVRTWDQTALELVEVVEGLVLKTDEDYEDAARVLKDIHAKWKELDELRKVAVRPFNEQVGTVNAMFRPVLTKLADLKTKFKQLMWDYSVAQRAEQERLLAASGAAALRQDAPAAAVLQQEALVMAAPRIQGISVGEVWDFEVADVNAVPREYLAVDVARVKEALKTGVREIPGLRIFAKPRIVARAEGG